jgi:hypothetical protein
MTTPTNDALLASARELLSTANARQANAITSASVSLPAEVLPAGPTYVFSLTVRNHIGSQSFPARLSVRKEARPLVMVTVDGEPSREVESAKRHVLAGHVVLPKTACIVGLEASITLGLQLSWRVTPRVSSDGLVTLEGGSKLLLLEHALSPDVSYTIHLFASPSTSTAVFGSNTSITVLARRSPLIVRIAGV